MIISVLSCDLREEKICSNKWYLKKVYLVSSKSYGKINKCNRFALVFFKNKNLCLEKKGCRASLYSDVITKDYWQFNKNKDLYISFFGTCKIIKLSENELVFRIYNDNKEYHFNHIPFKDK